MTDNSSVINGLSKVKKKNGLALHHTEIFTIFLLTCLAIGMIWMKYLRTICRSLSMMSKKRWLSGSIIRGLPHRLNPPEKSYLDILSFVNNGKCIDS